MSQAAEQRAEDLSARLGTFAAQVGVSAGEVVVDVTAVQVLDVARTLRDDDALAFHQLVDLCAVDYLDYGKADWETSEVVSASGFSRGVEKQVHDEGAAREDGRFAVVYHLLSHTHNARVRLRAMLEADPPRIDSVCEIWPGANWYEREAFDLYGILFAGHPDLRRLLTDYGFIGHPFRKDFPLIGEVEMRYDPARGRVVYEPVSIEPRTLVPKVIRHDERYHDDDSDEAA